MDKIDLCQRIGGRCRHEARFNCRTCVAAVVTIFTALTILSCAPLSGTTGATPDTETTTSAKGNKAMSQTASDRSSASTDIEALSKIIKLPARPRAVVWQRRALGVANSVVPGPTDWKLQAVLTFDEEQAQQIVAEAKKRERPSDVGTIEALDWLPAEVKQQMIAEPGTTAKYRLRGEAYDASEFMKPPLMNGYLIRIGETPQFFLSLHTQ